MEIPLGLKPELMSDAMYRSCQVFFRSVPYRPRRGPDPPRLTVARRHCQRQQRRAMWPHAPAQSPRYVAEAQLVKEAGQMKTMQSIRITISEI